MKWPWVSRARLDLALHNMEEMRSLHRSDVAYYRGWVQTQDKQIGYWRDLYVEATKPKAPPVPPSIEAVDVDMPPAVVLAAMETISPVRDKAYDANWAYWEKNKARAEAHPDAFAEEIIQGAVYEVAT